MAQKYEPTADVEVLLEALKQHATGTSFYTLAKIEKELVENERECNIARDTLKYHESKLAEKKAEQAKTRRKVAQLINALAKTDCPEVLIKQQWQSYDKQFVMPWPNGHDLAQWISKAE
jgi:hypothetical protein